MHVCVVMQPSPTPTRHSTHHSFTFQKNTVFIVLTAINTYKRGKRFSYKLTEINCSEKNIAERERKKNTFNCFTFFVSRSVHLFQTREGNPEHVTSKKKTTKKKSSIIKYKKAEKPQIPGMYI